MNEKHPWECIHIYPSKGLFRKVSVLSVQFVQGKGEYGFGKAKAKRKDEFPPSESV